ncbi:ATP-binding protein [Rhizohabitans arisaemae]|uniref:ATP-binding protein n=1 Tax=Rhizohabitans arisaemae TaxID=2720610 RepID=UPI0024B180A6|nr:sensor histidine kinase [Rhizohabitans arisaemae]
MERIRTASLGSQLFVLQMVIVLLAVGATATVWLQHTRARIDDQYEQRALAIAQSVAGLSSVRKGFNSYAPELILQPIALSVQHATKADYVVIANRDQIRYAHPNPLRIGERLSTDGSRVLEGHPWTGTETGTLGRSVRGKAPVFDFSGQVIGLVSVGILETTVDQQLGKTVTPLMWTVVAILITGGIAAALLARRLRRQTFGLEPREIAALFEQREAVLHGLKEGILAFDIPGRVTLINDSACELLGLSPGCVGSPLGTLPLSDRLKDVLSGVDIGEDLIVLHRDRVLVLNRVPVSVRGQRRGFVVTLRDRTELVRLTRDLDRASSTTDALRAQAHEFANRMHTVVGLLELEEYGEAVSYITQTTQTHHRFTGELRKRISDPMLTAFLLAKSAEAAERGVTLVLSPESNVEAELMGDPRDAVLVVGNLVDNALDALDGAAGEVEVGVRTTRNGLHIRVRDSGPGVAPELVSEVFQEGFTTKAAYAGPRGLGLALTRQTCIRRGGWVSVDSVTGHTSYPQWKNDRSGGERVFDDTPSPVGAVFTAFLATQ